MQDVIKTDRLTLRPLVAADGNAVVAILNDLTVSRWLVPIPHPFNHTDLRILNPDSSSRWPEMAAIEMDRQLIGGIGMGARLGYYLKPEQWGKGLMTEATQAAVAYTIGKLGCQKIASAYFEGNTGSKRILEKLGFQEVGRGTAHCAALKEDCPSVEMELTSDRWRAQQ